MTHVEKFLTKKQREREIKQGEMAEALKAMAMKIERGEITGYVISTVDPAGKATNDWKGNCPASQLAMAVGGLFHRFFHVHMGQK